MVLPLPVGRKRDGDAVVRVRQEPFSSSDVCPRRGTRPSEAALRTSVKPIRACVTRAQPCVAPSVGRVGAVGRGRPRLAGGSSSTVAGPAKAARRAATRAPQTPPRLPPPEACDGDRQRRDRDKRPETGEAGKPAERVAQICLRRPGPGSPDSAAMGVAVASGTRGGGIGGKGDPCRIGDDDRELAVDRLTVPLALTASVGSMSGRSWAASPSRTTKAEAVPSSIRMPRGSRSVTRPPTRTCSPTASPDRQGRCHVPLASRVARGGRRRRGGGTGVAVGAGPWPFVDPGAAADPVTRTSAG